METVLPSMISTGQTGFNKNHHSFTNIRGLLNIIHSAAHPTSPEMVILLDAEKAVDRVEWGHLFFKINKFGFGEKFISWLRLLYASPQTCVCTSRSHVAREEFTQFPPSFLL